MNEMLKILWRYRFFIITSIKTDFQTKFARSKLGSIWLILNPLAQVTMYAIVLSAVLSSKIQGISSRFGYAIYLLAGMLCWSLLTDLIIKSTTLFIDNSNLIKKMVFPKLALPLIMVGISLINNLILFFFILLVLIILNQKISLEILWMIPLVIITTITGLGFGLVFGILNVFIRDLGHIVPILLQFAFWFTPIVYPSSVVPEHLKYLLIFNPFYGMINSYQNVLVFGKTPDIRLVLIATVTALTSFILGMFLYKKASAEIVDAL